MLAGAAHAPEAAHTGYGGRDEHDIHMPSPSFFPLMASLGFPFIAVGIIYDYALVPVGVALLLIGVFGWALEPATEEA